MSHGECYCFGCMTQEVTRTTPLHKLVKRQFHPYVKQILKTSAVGSKRPRKLKSYSDGNTLWLDFVELANKKPDFSVELVDHTNRVISICENDLHDMNSHVHNIHVLNLPIIDTLDTITSQHHNSMVRMHGIVCKVEQIVEHMLKKTIITLTDVKDPSQTFTAHKYGEVVVHDDETRKIRHNMQVGQRLDITGVWDNQQTCMSINVALLLVVGNAETSSVRSNGSVSTCE